LSFYLLGVEHIFAIIGNKSIHRDSMLSALVLKQYAFSADATGHYLDDKCRRRTLFLHTSWRANIFLSSDELNLLKLGLML